MNANWETWSPFQSPEVREICANMTDTEKAKASYRAGFYGLWAAATFALPLTQTIIAHSSSGKVIAVVLVAIHIACIPIWQKMQRNFLCSTTWARERSITPDRLRLFAFRA